MSKKCLILISTLLLMVSMFSMVAYAAPQPKDMIFSADFEDGKLDAWTTIDGTVKVVDAPGGKGKCLFLDRTDEEAATHTAEDPTATLIQKDFEKPIEGTVTVEFKMMTNTLKQTKAFLVFNSDEGNEEEIPSTVLRAQFNGNKIRIVQPEGGTPLDIIQPFEVDKWYHFKMVINTATGKADVYVDGNKLADQIDTEIPSKNIAGIRTNLWGKVVATLHVDDIMVYQEGAGAAAPKADTPKADAPKADTPKAAAPKATAPKADAPKNPKTGDTGSILYGLLLVASVGTFVSIKRKAN